MNEKFNAAFWRWFKDSKVVDKRSQPLIVYHGTYTAFDTFARPGEFDGRHPSAALGIFFTASYEIAKEFAGSDEDEVVVAAFLRIQKPFKLTWSNFVRTFVHPADEDGDEYGVIEKANDFVASLRHDGYDGIFIPKSRSRYADFEAEADQYIVFEPNQIKSVDNDETWDVDDASTRSNPRRRR